LISGATYPRQFGMMKLFQHKTILRIILFGVLALAVFNVLAPRIQRYNYDVAEDQENRRIQANRFDDRVVSFGIYSDNPDFSGFFVIVLTVLFIHLIFTKRIIQSFIFFIFFTAFAVIETIAVRRYGSVLISNGYQFVRSVDFELLFFALVTLISYILAAWSCRSFYKNSVLT
jgi:hypothetical protein